MILSIFRHLARIRFVRSRFLRAVSKLDQRTRLFQDGAVASSVNIYVEICRVAFSNLCECSLFGCTSSLYKEDMCCGVFGRGSSPNAGTFPEAFNDENA